LAQLTCWFASFFQKYPRDSSLPPLIQCNAGSGSSLLLATEAFRALSTLSAPARMIPETGLQGSNLRLFAPRRPCSDSGRCGPWPLSSGLRHSTRLVLCQGFSCGPRGIAHSARPLPGSLPRSLVRVLFAVTTPQRGTGDICLFCPKRRVALRKSGAAPTSLAPPFPGFLEATAADRLPGLSQMLLLKSSNYDSVHPGPSCLVSGETPLDFSWLRGARILRVPLWDTALFGIRSIKELSPSLQAPPRSSIAKFYKCFITNNL
jgi:hypothetical protein